MMSALKVPANDASAPGPVIQVPRASPLAKRPAPTLQPPHRPGAQLASSSITPPFSPTQHHQGMMVWPPAHGVHADQNKRHRRHMEDAPKAVPELLGGEYAFFAVYDGHGGRTAVDFCAERLHENVTQELQRTDLTGTDASDVPQAIARAVLSTDEQLKPAGAYGCGSTAAILLLRRIPSGTDDAILTQDKVQDAQSHPPPDHGVGSGVGGHTRLNGAASGGKLSPSTSSSVVAYAANAGDSHIILLRRAPEGAPPLAPKRLSVEHSGKNEVEVARITDAGGFMRRGRVGCVLAVTRALGDHTLKEDESCAGLTAEPDVTAHHVDPAHDLGVLLVSDGITEALTDEECDAVVRQAIGKIESEAQAAEMAAREVVNAAMERGSRDNLSAVYVHFALAPHF